MALHRSWIVSGIMTVLVGQLLQVITTPVAQVLRSQRSTALKQQERHRSQMTFVHYGSGILTVKQYYLSPDKLTSQMKTFAAAFYVFIKQPDYFCAEGKDGSLMLGSTDVLEPKWSKVEIAQQWKFDHAKSVIKYLAELFKVYPQYEDGNEVDDDSVKNLSAGKKNWPKLQYHIISNRKLKMGLLLSVTGTAIFLVLILTGVVYYISTRPDVSITAIDWLLDSTSQAASSDAQPKQQLNDLHYHRRDRYPAYYY